MMATSKLETIISNAISGLKKIDKSKPIRPHRLDDLSLQMVKESSQTWGSGPWSTVTSPQAALTMPEETLASPLRSAWADDPWSNVASPKPPSVTKSLPTKTLASPESPHSTKRAQSFPQLSPRPPPPTLKQRRYAKQGPRSLDDRMAQLEIENTSLRQANDVLYQQNSDYRDLLQEYRVFQEAATSIIDGNIGIVDVLEDVTKGIRADAKAYQLSRAKLRRVEKGKVNDWRKFVETKAEAGIHVQEVVKEVVDKHSMEASKNSRVI